MLVLAGACSEKPRGHKPSGEETVVSYHPGGEVRETAVIEGTPPGVRKLKSFEYYPGGQSKKLYNFKDNNYYGPWKYWYRDGSVLAEGIVTRKSADIFYGSGTATYYWPTGERMLAIDSRPERPEDRPRMLYLAKTGEQYTNETVTDELKTEIVTVLTQWRDYEL